MKTDKKLGYQVKEYLIQHGVETPNVDVKLVISGGDCFSSSKP